ncbi:MAG: membrane protein insertase YidC [Bacteriovoracaceae bacterium]|mgnify:CR=1 FL=1|jgi:YidC/Oxa1 family membrane protein insertase|nr:membrane protein insertase YidC [Bacteriovoracaceae bacterium]
MTNSEQKRAILAVVLSGLVLFTWQAFFAPKHPISTPEILKSETVNPAAITASSALNPAPKKAPLSENIKSTTSASNINNANQALELKSITLLDDKREYNIGSYLTLSNIKNSESFFSFDEVVGHTEPLNISILNGNNEEKIYFDFQNQMTENSVEGLNEKYNIKIILRINDKGLLAFNLSSPTAFKYRIRLQSSPSEETSTQQNREYVYFAEEVERITVGDAETGEAKFKWFGVDFKYHFSGFVFHEKQPVKFRSFEKSSDFVVDLSRPVTNFSGDYVFIKKNYDTLKDLGNQLDLSIDFGILGIIAVPMLKGLQLCYSYFPNYGIALILLTIFIRMLLFPLSFASFKSMKKMQKIQPELAKLKEKFKDDPPRMQKETMALFKQAGANPLGGCLPMLLQMPIFFAFYRVLYGAVELVGAPFYGWIHDLSIADPYYVLPVIMAITMFIQQKLTPSTSADPTQQKVMMFMPLIFGFIMKDLPAGLNLYIAVSTAFGIGQQLLVYRLTD